jgi:hypothetical protein
LGLDCCVPSEERRNTGTPGRPVIASPESGQPIRRVSSAWHGDLDPAVVEHGGRESDDLDHQRLIHLFHRTSMLEPRPASASRRQAWEERILCALRLVPVAVLGLVPVCAISCGGDTPASAPATSSSRPVASPAPEPPSQVTPKAAARYLALLAPRRSVLRPYVAEGPASTSLKYVSLDYCNRDWSSDSQRLAQRYQAFGDRASESEANQNLGYYESGGASEAFTEWSSAFRSCRRFHGTGTAKSLVFESRRVRLPRLPFDVDGEATVVVTGITGYAVIVVGFRGDLAFVCDGNSRTTLHFASLAAGKCLGATGAALDHVSSPA